jgi:hypothetical protein
VLAFPAFAVAGLTTPAGAVTSAAQCWALSDGFLVNHYGYLSLTEPSSAALLLLA